MVQLREKSYVEDLSAANINEMSEEQMLLTIHSYLDNLDVVCRRKIRMGKIGDGGWEICDDPDVRPHIPCIIYSFGISYDFSFDDDAAGVYGCHVYSFDPSMTKMDTSQRSERVMYYKLGLSGSSYVTTKNWDMNTLQNIRKDLKHDNVTLDVLKMDIEGSEWDALRQSAASGQLESVRQLLVEYHVISRGRDYLLPRLQTLQAVEKAGFKRFYVHKNVHCPVMIKGYPVVRTKCYEVHYIKPPHF